ncbi:MAG TPA: carbohydrate binding domain-containing protein [Polyangia bacterium]|nr:carbohydrate binding domain-containing protein [Polyangia bacterium]
MRRSLSLSNLLALVSVAGLAVGCNGEQALKARDAAALSSTGGDSPTGTGGSGAGGMAGGVAATGGSSSGGATGGSVVIGTGGMSTGGHAGAVAGNGGSAGGGMGGMAGSHGTKANGVVCGGGSECVTGFCFDGVCCSADCSGKCRTCNGATPGTCTLVPDGMDPDNECDQQNPETCGTSGTCNGLGACKMYDSTTVCDPTKACDNASAGVIQNRVCDGAGKCVAGKDVSCKGFLCSGAACATTCSSDTACVAGGFCSASSCVAAANVVGNGDLETGTLTGWAGANGLPSVSLSSAAAGGPVHSGNYSVYGPSRGMTFQGPGYALPTGPGKYMITAWGMQKDDDLATVAFQIRVDCPDNTTIPGSYVAIAYGVPIAKGVWTQFSAMVDTADLSVVTPGCLAATPGYTKTAVLYLNQINMDTPVGDSMFPDLYLDDVVVTVPDGHNLIGNPNFEAGVTVGWTPTAGTFKLSSTASSGFAHTGVRSLSLPGRATSTAGIKYALPTGTARYDISFWAMQNGTQTHQLQLQPSYTCIPPTNQPAVTVTPPPSTAVTAAPGVWVQVGGRFVFPPIDAAPGCVLQQASVTLQQVEQGACSTVECPDLFLDDAAVIIPVQ